ncbi:hypothetical protein, partial [Streptococcus sobrinus]|uniref:hypothetical protein n=1 Tax=Streptococcus sobrinus TaxID=1310 RepID=UPI0005B461F7
MADGRVEIDARINNTNIRKDVEETNKELQRVGENMGQAGKQATKQMSQNLTDMSNSAKNAYQSMTNYANASGSAMHQAA